MFQKPEVLGHRPTHITDGLTECASLVQTPTVPGSLTLDEPNSPISQMYQWEFYAASLIHTSRKQSRTRNGQNRIRNRILQYAMKWTSSACDRSVTGWVV